MNVFKMPFLFLVSAIMFNVIISCTDSNNEKSNISMKVLSREETISLVALDIYNLNEFSNKNFKQLNILKNELKLMPDLNLVPFLKENRFLEVERIQNITQNYSNHLENLKFYLDLEKKHGLNNIQDTRVFIDLCNEIKKLNLLKNPFSTYKSLDLCATSFNNDIQDCNDAALIQSALAIAAAGAGIIPGLVAAVGVMAESKRCKNAASRDYQICLNNK